METQGQHALHNLCIRILGTAKYLWIVHFRVELFFHILYDFWVTRMSLSCNELANRLRNYQHPVRTTSANTPNWSFTIRSANSFVDIDFSKSSLPFHPRFSKSLAEMGGGKWTKLIGFVVRLEKEWIQRASQRMDSIHSVARLSTWLFVMMGFTQW